MSAQEMVKCRKSVSEKLFAKSLLFYCFCAGVFTVGYFVGVLQSSGWCSETTFDIDRIPGSQLKVQKHTALFIVLIFSAPSNHERRQIVRKTWLLTKGNLSIQHFFTIGSASLDSAQIRALQNEHNEFGDLLILDSVSDSYSKLSGKLRDAFRWLDKYMEYTFLLKVDDDSFVRLDALFAQMIKQPKEKLYWGFFDGQARVKSKGKWREKAWFLCDRYLPYAKGGGYVLTSDLIHNIVLTSNYLSLYQSEDVALGTWLAPFEIKRLHDPQFDTEYVSRGCFNSYLVTHKQSTSMMLSKYKNLKQTGKLCLQEYRDRNSYEYNWNVPASLCCVRNNSQIP